MSASGTGAQRFVAGLWRCLLVVLVAGCQCGPCAHSAEHHRAPALRAGTGHLGRRGVFTLRPPLRGGTPDLAAPENVEVAESANARLREDKDEDAEDSDYPAESVSPDTWDDILREFTTATGAGIPEHDRRDRQRAQVEAEARSMGLNMDEVMNDPNAEQYMQKVIDSIAPSTQTHLLSIVDKVLAEYNTSRDAPDVCNPFPGIGRIQGPVLRSPQVSALEAPSRPLLPVSASPDPAMKGEQHGRRLAQKSEPPAKPVRPSFEDSLKGCFAANAKGPARGTGSEQVVRGSSKSGARGKSRGEEQGQDMTTVQGGMARVGGHERESGHERRARTGLPPKENGMHNGRQDADDADADAFKLPTFKSVEGRDMGKAEFTLMKVIEEAASGLNVEGVEERLMRVGGEGMVLLCALRSIDEDSTFVGRVLQRLPLPPIGLLPYGVWSRPPHHWDSTANFQPWGLANLCGRPLLAATTIPWNMHVALKAAREGGCLLVDGWGQHGWGKTRAQGSSERGGSAGDGHVEGDEGKAYQAARPLPQSHTVGIPVWCAVLNRCVRGAWRPGAQATPASARATAGACGAGVGGGQGDKECADPWQNSLATELVLHPSVPREVRSAVERKLPGLEGAVLEHNEDELRALSAGLCKPLRPLWLSPETAARVQSLPDLAELAFTPVFIVMAGKSAPCFRNLERGMRQRVLDVQALSQGQVAEKEPEGQAAEQEPEGPSVKPDLEVVDIKAWLYLPWAGWLLSSASSSSAGDSGGQVPFDRRGARLRYEAYWSASDVLLAAPLPDIVRLVSNARRTFEKRILSANEWCASAAPTREAEHAGHQGPERGNGGGASDESSFAEGPSGEEEEEIEDMEAEDVIRVRRMEHSRLRALLVEKMVYLSGEAAGNVAANSSSSADQACALEADAEEADCGSVDAGRAGGVTVPLALLAAKEVALVPRILLGFDVVIACSPSEHTGKPRQAPPGTSAPPAEADIGKICGGVIDGVIAALRITTSWQGYEGGGQEVRPPFDYKQMVFSTNSFQASRDLSLTDALVEREASRIAFSRQMSETLDYLWRQLAVARRSMLLVCSQGKSDSVFIAVVALCHCYRIPPDGSPQLRHIGAGRGGLTAKEVDDALAYVQRIHGGALVTRVMRRALLQTFVAERAVLGRRSTTTER